MFGLRKIQRRSTTDADESARSGVDVREDASKCEGKHEANAFTQGSAEEIQSELRVIDDILESGVEVIAGENGLTRREREILGYLARGRSARYIAEDLVISENTVWRCV